MPTKATKDKKDHQTTARCSLIHNKNAMGSIPNKLRNTHFNVKSTALGNLVLILLQFSLFTFNYTYWPDPSDAKQY